jgi:cytochrome c oxidase subunit 2
MKEKTYLIGGFVVAFSVLLFIPFWHGYGVLLPEEGGGHAHGGEEVDPAEFIQKTNRYIARNQLEDGSVQAVPDHGDNYLIAAQYSWKPDKIRMVAGEDYSFKIVSVDVVHTFSVVMGDSAYTTVVMPDMVTELEIHAETPGEYLMVCYEYCGIGHDLMFTTFVVE